MRKGAREELGRSWELGMESWGSSDHSSAAAQRFPTAQCFMSAGVVTPLSWPASLLLGISYWICLETQAQFVSAIIYQCNGEETT